VFEQPSVWRLAAGYLWWKVVRCGAPRDALGIEQHVPAAGASRQALQGRMSPKVLLCLTLAFCCLHQLAALACKHVFIQLMNVYVGRPSRTHGPKVSDSSLNCSLKRLACA
jgi:hypothetical protein